MIQATSKTLYDQDFALWVDETVIKLKKRDFNQIDWDNLIEEVDSLGSSQRKAVYSFLWRLLEHLLKRCYVELPDCYRGWEIEIKNFRQELKKQFKSSPSLKVFMLENFYECYQDALESMREDYSETGFPDDCPFPNDVESLLTEKFWEIEQ